MRYFYVIIYSILFTCCGNNKNKEATNLNSDFDAIKHEIVNRLSKNEFGLSKVDICYLEPTLDSVKAWGFVTIERIDSVLFTKIPLRYIDLNLVSLEIMDKRFLFTSQIEKDLIAYNNENYLNEPNPEMEDLGKYSDIQEFLQLIAYLNKNLGDGKQLKDTVAWYFTRCFLSGMDLSDDISLFSGQINNESDLNLWKDIHLQDKKEFIDFEFDQGNYYYKILNQGVLMFDLDENQKATLLKKIYPNDVSYASSYDSGPFYLEVCSE